MGDHPLRPPTRRRLGGPSPRQLANGARGHPPAINVSAPPHAGGGRHPVSGPFSQDCSGLGGGFLTCYSPFRHFTRGRGRFLVRLACLIHAASVHSEPGSNSPYENIESLTAPSFMRRGRAFWFYSLKLSGVPSVSGRRLTSVCRFYYALHRNACMRHDARRRTRIALPNFQGAVPAFFAKTRLKLPHISFFANRQVAFF